MSNEITVLAMTAAITGFIHTIVGPDHYLPFIVLSKARKWTGFKTFMVTFLCGLGHVLSSIALGFLGILLGIAVFKLEWIESFRGDLASWFLITVGFVYFIWGLRVAIRKRPHKHCHPHESGREHLHTHQHIREHSHVHVSKRTNLTPWILFLIFVFGPCEPLIPLIMYPAARHNMLAVILVALAFGLTTILTMLAVVLSSSYGLAKLPFGRLERFSHALAGFTIFACGGSIKFLGL